MPSELLQYTGSNIYVSTDQKPIYRVIAEKQFDRGDFVDLEFKAISFHANIAWERFDPGADDDSNVDNTNPRSLALETLAEIASRIDVPLLWFGENNINYTKYAEEGGNDADGPQAEKHRTVKFGEIILNEATNDFDASAVRTVKLANLREEISDALGTNLSEIGAHKTGNSHRTPFQKYTSAFLPTDYLIQDIDAFYAESPRNPKTLIEIKRTRYDPSKWTPWPQDHGQYCMLLKLAEAADLQAIVLQHHKHQLNPETDLWIYKDMECPRMPKKISSIDSYDHETAAKYLGTPGTDITARELMQYITTDQLPIDESDKQDDTEVAEESDSDTQEDTDPDHTTGSTTPTDTSQPNVAIRPDIS